MLKQLHHVLAHQLEHLFYRTLLGEVREQVLGVGAVAALAVLGYAALAGARPWGRSRTS